MSVMCSQYVWFQIFIESFYLRSNIRHHQCDLLTCHCHQKLVLDFPCKYYITHYSADFAEPKQQYTGYTCTLFLVLLVCVLEYSKNTTCTLVNWVFTVSIMYIQHVHARSPQRNIAGTSAMTGDALQQ